MRMPEIRDRLHEIADEHGIDELHELAEQTRRKFNGRAARKVSQTVTPEVSAAMRAFYRAFPDQALHQVGRVFEVNQGRVSEALRGKRR